MLDGGKQKETIHVVSSSAVQRQHVCCNVSRDNVIIDNAVDVQSHCLIATRHQLFL